MKIRGDKNGAFVEWTDSEWAEIFEELRVAEENAPVVTDHPYTRNVGRDQWDGPVIRRWVRRGVFVSRENRDSHPRLDSLKLDLIDDIRNRADADYVAACRDLSFGDVAHYFWNASQAIEKHCKVALVTNGVAPTTNNSGHDISGLYDQVLALAPSFVLKPTYNFGLKTRSKRNKVSEFIEDIETYGSPGARYYESYSMERGKGKLLRLLFGLRRLSCLPLDYPVGSSTYEDYLKSNPKKPVQLITDIINAPFIDPDERGFIPEEMKYDNASFRQDNYAGAHAVLGIRVIGPMKSDIKARKKTPQGKEAYKYALWIRQNIDKRHGDLFDLIKEYGAI